jgi:hypothetical protein
VTALLEPEPQPIEKHAIARSTARPIRRHLETFKVPGGTSNRPAPVKPATDLFAAVRSFIEHTNAARQ